MSDLSASASIVLNYARSRSNKNGIEINDDIGLPEHIVDSACKELKAKGYVTDITYSEDSVEAIALAKSVK